ncbi:pilus assembly FimT family protein [Acinetobacter indicus]|uniref:pilus assembly FimT family protein n=1 Tax=Acinetobacter indicus TaxID=756892 RepID=UPI000CECBD84|nr:GspH/FimT family pseudopilin [Acinetobacter indicus]
MQRRQNGLTLIELMVTIAILGIIATMAAPSFNNMIMNQNLKASTNSLVQEIKKARATAILNKQSVTLNLDSTNSDTYSSLNWAPSGDVRLKDSLHTQLIFDGNGQLTTFNTFSEIELCKKNGVTDSKKITLTLLGQVEKIEEGTCT